MSIVADIILEHLKTNRRLVVPEFGAFMVKDTGELVFSELLRTDDGVLTSLLLNSGMSEMEAAVVIDRFLFEVRHELEQYEYCRLGEIGTLRIEPDTRVLRLYPPVKSEEVLPEVQPPYVPTPIVGVPADALLPDGISADGTPAEEVAPVEETPAEELSAEEAPAEDTPVEETLSVVEETSAEEVAPAPQPEEVAAQPEEAQPKVEKPKSPKAKRRIKFDLVMVVVIIVSITALALIALTIYNAHVSDKADNSADNAAMDNIRTTTINS